MGHLTFISDEVVKLLDRYPNEILAAIADGIDLASWNEYVDKQLRDTKERDRAPLGGQRPSGQGDPDMRPGEQVEDIMGPSGHSDPTNDQISRFLNPRMLGDDSDEDEDEGSWMGDFDHDQDFDMRGTAFSSRGIGSFSHRDALGDDFGLDSDEDDEIERRWAEDISSPTGGSSGSGIPENWTTNFSAPFVSAPLFPGKEPRSGSLSHQKAWPSPTKVREHRTPLDDDDDDDDGGGNQSFDDYEEAGTSNDDVFSGFIGISKVASTSSPQNDDDSFDIPLNTSPTDNRPSSVPTWTSFGSEFGEFRKAEDPNVVPALRTKEEYKGYKGPGLEHDDDQQENH